MRINTNVGSLKARFYLRGTDDKLQTAMERLSSGKRINSAKDDAAGLAISSRMEGQIRGMRTAMRNAQDGVSLLETSEAALGNVNNILQRMRELSVQADNGTYSTKDRQSLNEEFSVLVEEIDHIAKNASFNGIATLNGVNTAVTLHISDKFDDTMTVGLVDSTATTGLGVGALDISTAAGAQAAITAIDTAIDTVTSGRAELGSSMNRLEFTIDNLQVMSNNLDAAKSRIADADMAEEVSSMTKNQILMQSTMSMLTQANQNPQMVLQLLQ